MNETLPILSRADYAGKISAAWNAGREAVLEAGRWLAKAKKDLPHGEFLPMIERDLPFGDRTARHLMAIADDDRLTNRNHGSVLPASHRTLYELSRLDDETFDRCIDDGTIHPEMERQEVTALLKADKRQQTERALGQRAKKAEVDLGRKQYGVIIADPPWQHETWSEAGKDRAAENHYLTTPTVELAGLEVKRAALDDCVLFMWSTSQHLEHAMELLRNWGFEYKSFGIWQKPKMGTGYWFRQACEIVLIGTRGNIPAPLPGTQIASPFAADSVESGRHSSKPPTIHEYAERHWPNIPRLEMFARTNRDGWDSWGTDELD